MSDEMQKEDIQELQNEELEAENLEENQEQEADEIENLKAQIERLKDENMRETADFLNIKKRLEKEKYQAIDFANEGFARDLLPIIDALENALDLKVEDESQSVEVVAKYKEGIELTLEQFKKCLEKHGIKQVPLDGAFDPNVHEAIMQVDDPENKGNIVQTLQKGYTIKDRVLRPAMVSIAK